MRRYLHLVEALQDIGEGHQDAAVDDGAKVGALVFDPERADKPAAILRALIHGPDELSKLGNMGATLRSISRTIQYGSS